MDWASPWHGRCQCQPECPAAPNVKIARLCQVIDDDLAFRVPCPARIARVRLVDHFRLGQNDKRGWFCFVTAALELECAPNIMTRMIFIAGPGPGRHGAGSCPIGPGRVRPACTGGPPNAPGSPCGPCRALRGRRSGPPSARRQPPSARRRRGRRQGAYAGRGAETAALSAAAGGVRRRLGRPDASRPVGRPAGCASTRPALPFILCVPTFPFRCTRITEELFFDFPSR